MNRLLPTPGLLASPMRWLGALLMLLAVAPMAGASVTRVSNVIAEPGGPAVSVVVAVRGNGSTRAVGFDLSFPSSRLSISAFPRNGALQCTVNAASGVVIFRSPSGTAPLPTNEVVYCELLVQARPGTSGTACIGSPNCVTQNSPITCSEAPARGTLPCTLQFGTVTIQAPFLGSASTFPQSTSVAPDVALDFGTVCGVSSAPGYPRGFCTISLLPTTLRRGSACNGSTDYVVLTSNVATLSPSFITNLFNVPFQIQVALTLRNCGLATGSLPFSVASYATTLSTTTSVNLNSCVAPAQASSDFPCVRMTGSNGSLSLQARQAPVPTPLVNASTGTGGAPANAASRTVQLSARGDFVVFESDASNLVSGDSNARRDVFRRNVRSGEIVRVSVATGANGAQQDFQHGQAKVSSDGNRVVYSRGTSLPTQSLDDPTPAKLLFGAGQVCFRDIATNQTQCASQTVQGAPGNQPSGNPAIDTSGRFILFESLASNLAPAGDPDTNGVADIYESDSVTQQIRRVSSFAASDVQNGDPDPKSNAKVQGNAASTNPRSSCNGQFRVFESARSGLNQIWLQAFSAGALAVSVPLVRGLGGTAPNGSSRNAQISNDGQAVVFESDATNLVSGDNNQAPDIFLLNRADQTIALISRTAAGGFGNGASTGPQTDCAFSSVSFDSLASNLVANDTNNLRDAFLFDRPTQLMAMLSQTPGGQVGQGSSGGATVAPDGSSVGLESSASNLPGASANQSAYSGVNPFATLNFSGAWFNRNQSGHGLLIEQLNNNAVFATWFTYDPAGSGTQRWFVGTGTLNGNVVDLSVVDVLGSGARFIPDWQANQITRRNIGSMRITFSGCAAGQIDYNLSLPYGIGTYVMERLTTPIGVTCNGTPALGSARGPIASMTGAWFDPAQSGHGLQVQNLANNEVFATWYTYDNTGIPAWLVGSGTINGNSVVLSVLRPIGGGWVPNFNPNAVQRPQIGTMTLTMSGCNTGRVDYALDSRFGSGFMTLNRLTDVKGTSCTP